MTKNYKELNWVRSVEQCCCVKYLVYYQQRTSSSLCSSSSTANCFQAKSASNPTTCSSDPFMISTMCSIYPCVAGMEHRATIMSDGWGSVIGNLFTLLCDCINNIIQHLHIGAQVPQQGSYVWRFTAFDWLLHRVASCPSVLSRGDDNAVKCQYKYLLTTRRQEKCDCEMARNHLVRVQVTDQQSI